MNSSALLASFALVLLLAACTAPAEDATVVAQTEDELSLGNRTFRVGPKGDGCSFPYGTLYVKRGGKVTFDNGSWFPSDQEVTGDDNLRFLIEWPNRFGEDGAAMFDVTIGTKKTLTVPYLDDELFGGASSLDFDVYCTSEYSGLDVTAVSSQAKIRIHR